MYMLSHILIILIAIGIVIPTNIMEGEIVPDSSPFSFVNFYIGNIITIQLGALV